jgi:hypothetical protein
MAEHEISSIKDKYSQLYENKTLSTIGLLLVIFGFIVGIASLVNSIPLLLISNRIFDLESFRNTFKGIDDRAVLSIHNNVQTILVCFVNLNLIKATISIIGIFGGFGMLRKMAYGIKVSRTWAWLAIIYLLSDSVIYLSIVIPAAVNVLTIMPINISGTIPDGLKSLINIAIGIVYTMVLITNLIMVVLPFATIRTFKKYESG